MTASSSTTASSTTVNIAQRLSATAHRLPDKPAIIVAQKDGSYRNMTFRQLEEETDRCATGLASVGAARGMRTILMVKPGFDFFALTFALFRIGAVPVLIDPGMGRRQLVESLEDVGAEAFVGIPLAHVGRKLYAKSFRDVKIVVTVGRRWLWGGVTLSKIKPQAHRAFATAPTRADELAAILFTSGSTGPAKGVEYTHGTLDAQVNYLKTIYGYSPDEVDIATFPPFALFGAALGMTAVIPDMDPTKPAQANPEKIARAIHDCGATHMFGSPALLDRLSRHAVGNGVRFPTLRRIMTAGAPVPASVLKRMRLVIPEEADIHTPYGATESLPVATIESREILDETATLTAQGKGICVGKPLPGISLGIVPVMHKPIEAWSADRCLPRGEIGEICVKGPVVTRAYFRDEQATRLAKIPEGDTLWHRMGDVGYLDTDGRLWFCGRKTHIVNTSKRRLFTVCCEAIFNQHPQVRRSALVGTGPPKAQTPVLCVELEPSKASIRKAEITEALRDIARKNPLTEQIHTFLYHPGFPVDVRHNAKIFREKLAVWAEEKV